MLEFFFEAVLLIIGRLLFNLLLVEYLDLQEDFLSLLGLNLRVRSDLAPVEF